MDVYPPPPYPTYAHQYPPPPVPFGYLPLPTCSPQNFSQPPPYTQPTLLYDSYPYAGGNLGVTHTQPPVPPPHYTLYSPTPFFAYPQEEYLPQEDFTEKNESVVEGSPSPDLSCYFSSLSLHNYNNNNNHNNNNDKYQKEQQIENDQTFARLFLEAESKKEEILLRAKEELIKQDEEFARRLISEEKQQLDNPEKPVPEIPTTPSGTGTVIKLEVEKLLKDELLARDLEQMRKDEELAQRLEQTRKDEEMARRLFEDDKRAIAQQQKVVPPPGGVGGTHPTLPISLRRHALKLHKRYCKCKGSFSDVHLVYVHDSFCQCVVLKNYAPHVHDNSCCTKDHPHNTSCRCSRYNPQNFLYK